MRSSSAPSSATACCSRAARRSASTTSPAARGACRPGRELSQAYFFTTPEALATFHTTRGLELGAGVDFAVADIGASGQISTSTLQKPVIVFVYGQQGLFAGVNVAGQKITERSDRT